MFSSKYYMKLHFLSLFFLVAMLIGFSCQSEQKNYEQAFPRIIWTYWDGPITKQAPYIVQLCNNRFKKFSQANNYKYNFATDGNLNQFIENYQTDVVQVLKNSERETKGTAKSDIIRMTLLKYHGGIYFDISAILLDQFNLKWLEQLHKYDNYVFNQYSQKPDVLMFTYGYYESTVINTNSEGKLFNDYPGFQIWFVASVKNSQFIKDWLQTYKLFTMKGFDFYTALFRKQDVYIRNIDGDRSYWSGNMALMYTLHKKQALLDKKTSFIERTNVHDYYKIWAIHGQVGPMYTAFWEQHFETKIFLSTLKQIQIQDGKINFFIKMNGSIRNLVEEFLQKLKIQIIDKNITYNQMMIKPPQRQDCNTIKYIVKDSPIYETLADQDRIVYKNAIINVSQRNQWEKYCQMLESQGQSETSWTKNIQFFLMNIFNPRIYQRFFQEINNYWSSNIYATKDNSRTKLLLLYQKKANLSKLGYLMKYLQINRVFFAYIFLSLVIIAIGCGVFFTFGVILKFGSLFLLRKFFKIQMKNCQIEVFNVQELKYSKKTEYLIFTSLIISKFLIIACGACYHYSVIEIGMYNLPFETMVFSIFVTLYDKISKLVQKKIIVKIFRISLKQFNVLTSLAMYYYLAYGFFSILRRRMEYFTAYGIIFGLIAPCLSFTAKSITVNFKKSQIRLIISLLKMNYLLIITVALMLINLIPNLLFVNLFDIQIKQLTIALGWGYIAYLLIVINIAVLYWAKALLTPSKQEISYQSLNLENNSPSQINHQQKIVETQNSQNNNSNLYEGKPLNKNAFNQCPKNKNRTLLIVFIRTTIILAIIYGLLYEAYRIPHVYYDKFNDGRCRFYHFQLIYSFQLIFYTLFYTLNMKLITKKRNLYLYFVDLVIVIFLIIRNPFEKFEIIYWNSLQIWFFKFTLSFSILSTFYQIFYNHNNSQISSSRSLYDNQNKIKQKIIELN